MPVQDKFKDYSHIPSTRSKLVDLLEKDAICAELGVGNGWLSLEFCQRAHVKKVYSIDMWASPRARKRKQQAVKKLQPFGEKSEIIQSTFAECVDQFENEYFDFIHIDGFPKFGYDQEFNDWFPKLKTGGIISVHDYNPKFPLNIKSIRNFCAEQYLDDEMICGFSDKFWTWWAIKGS